MLRTMLTRRMPIKGPRTKKCAVKTCRAPFVPEKTFITWCSPDCGHAIAVAKVAKQKTAQARAARKAVRDDRAETKKKLSALKSRADWQREAQAAVNAYVRARDASLPCISCRRHHEGQYHAGHYLARGSHPHLALVEANLAKQCAPCNTHLSGNQLKFRVGLIERIGLEAVEALESDTTPRKHTMDDLREIRDTYKAKLRAMNLEKPAAVYVDMTLEDLEAYDDPEPMYRYEQEEV